MSSSVGPLDLLRYWTTFERPVDRRAYLIHGAGLVAFKYAVDSMLIWAATGSVWLPWSYLRTSPLQMGATLEHAPAFLAPLLVIWTLPFLWIGVCMTMRRLLDARLSAWWSLLFFVPLAGYALMVGLTLAPSREQPVTSPPDPQIRKLPAALQSIVVGAALGIGMLYLAVVALNSYGMALFLGTPFAVGAVVGFLLCRRYPATVRETIEAVVMTAFLIAGAALALGWEGAVCLIMVMPLSILLASMGGIFGRAMAQSPASLRSMAIVPVLLTGGVSAEVGSQGGPLREVRSSVVVDAPPEVVWDNVVAFSPLPAPRELIFRLGVAYPTHARIQGEGVGAIRYCEFSTGPFVEPITVWDHPRRLAFDVSSSPQPLTELSPYRIKPPHLDGFLNPKRGEFRLVSLADGGTRLEGSTWYHQSLRPDGYWVLFSDLIIRKIHRRVLQHIKAEAESR